jgi:hypothetical protein
MHSLSLRLIRKLNLQSSSEPNRPAYLSSASGLVRTGAELCVVADDELHLGRFSLDHQQPGQLTRLFSGLLPKPNKQRKKRKPDLEVLLRLPACMEYPYGALLALGSGSGKHRRRGALLKIGARGRVIGRACTIEAEQLYARLAQNFSDLNLEGGWISQGRLHLLQRGNKGGSPNAVLQWDAAAVMRSMLRDGALPDSDPIHVRELDLGDAHGVPLCFTDASPLADDSWVFSAVAENTINSYSDGACMGAAVGCVNARGRLRWIKPVQPTYKIEGIDAELINGKLQALLVTDADDPAVPASLLKFR